jgi:hypothetical protein
MEKKEAKVFGHIQEDGNYFNLFECSCGSREWITESVETTRKFSCKKCGETYILIKNPNWHYKIMPENDNKS